MRHVSSRRRFIRDIAVGTLGTSAALGRAGCGSSDDGPHECAGTVGDAPGHGVAIRRHRRQGRGGAGNVDGAGAGHPGAAVDSLQPGCLGRLRAGARGPAALGQDARQNLLSLAGDTHNAWASDLQDASGAAVGVGFATPSVSSPGLEAVFVNEEPKAFAGSLAQPIGPLVYTDTSQRSFMVLTATPAEARADWTFVSTVTSRSYTASTQRSLKTLAGSGNRKIVEVSSAHGSPL